MSDLTLAELHAVVRQMQAIQADARARLRYAAQHAEGLRA